MLDFETGGWIAGLVAGLDSLIKLADDQTRIVPADGPILTRADLQAQRASYFTIYERLVKSLTQGLGPAEALAPNPPRASTHSGAIPSPFSPWRSRACGGISRRTREGSYRHLTITEHVTFAAAKSASAPAPAGTAVESGRWDARLQCSALLAGGL